MMKLVTVLTAAPKSGIKRDDDFIDRLSNRYTVGIIVMFAVTIGLIQSNAKAIVCWCPKHFTGSHCKFANNYCWIRNTYHLPYDDHIPKEDDTHDYILYYQWLPMVLLTQAAMFYAPSIFWHGLNQKSGVDADHILQNAGMVHKTKKGKDRNGVIKLIVLQMHRFLLTPRLEQSGWQAKVRNMLHCWGPRLGNYLVVLYILSKVLYIANIIGQLFMLNALLRTNYNIFGYEYLTNIQNATYADNSDVFPRVTMCDFETRRLGNVQRYTIQCTLPLNHFVEKMYVFLWFWMVLLCAASVAGLIIWISRLAFRVDRLRFIRNHLRSVGEMDDPHAKELTAIFLDDYLKQDGAFLLRLIIHNTSHICCTEIMQALYKHWRDNVWNHKYNSTLPNSLPKGVDDSKAIEEGVAAVPSAPEPEDEKAELKKSLLQ
jgi:hypothetical protein